jgi:Rrf2 family protein
MKVSKKSDYALRVLMTLVEFNGREPISIRVLAESNHVPKAFLEHILLDLKSMGWVKSTPGKYGGYSLAKAPEEITMGQVLRHFENILAPIHCVSLNQYEKCTQEPVCRFRRVLLQVRNETAHLMDNTTLAMVYAGKPVIEAEVFDEVLMGGAGI